MSYSSRDPHPIRTFLDKFFIGKERYELLENYGWFKSMFGGWTDSHCRDHMSYSEIVSLTPDRLRYKLEHGSMSILPPELRKEQQIRLVNSTELHVLLDQDVRWLFLCKEDRHLWVAVDNTTGDRWTEEFRTKRNAIKWLKRKIEP
ncbi:MAG: hypothetical protein NC548_13240 [Lachnospiraceae bacterium]|nr:hypothetical protein [Lachnospiraceae bacterium]MCM1230645.1 hypothetical protein [Ruminococcus flavefaciens]MCM1439999.1 hypothetical protein [Roseburia sp.]